MTLKRKVRTLAVALSRTTSKSDSRLETLCNNYYGSSDWVGLSGTNWCDCGALKLHADELPPALQDNCVWLQNDQYTAASINHKRPSTLSELVGYCPFWWPPPPYGLRGCELMRRDSYVDSCAKHIVLVYLRSPRGMHIPRAMLHLS